MVIAQHRDLFSMVAEQQQNHDFESAEWNAIAKYISTYEAIPSHLRQSLLKPKMTKGNGKVRVISTFTSNLAKVLSRQCRISGFKISDVKDIDELRTLEWDHITTYYYKSGDVSKIFANPQGYSTRQRKSNPIPVDRIVERTLFEISKCGIIHAIVHERGGSDDEKHINKLRRPLLLSYKAQSTDFTKRCGERPRFPDIAKDRKFLMLINDWVSRGAWESRGKRTNDKGHEHVRFQALAIAPAILWGVALEDIMPANEREFDQATHKTNCSMYATNALECLIFRLGGCALSPCAVDHTKMNAYQLQMAFDMNHIIPWKKLENGGELLSNTKHSIEKWYDQGSNKKYGGVEAACKIDHRGKIDKYQKGVIDCPKGYKGIEGKTRISRRRRQTV